MYMLKINKKNYGINVYEQHALAETSKNILRDDEAKKEIYFLWSQYKKYMQYVCK
jgi:hypothetical protein